MAASAVNVPVLQLSGVGHRFGSREVLRDVNLSLAGPGITVVVGPSGCGKTTLVRIAAGLLTPTVGTVRNGFPKVACVFQEDRLLPWWRVADNVGFGLKAAKAPRVDRADSVARALRRVGLTEEDGRAFPHQLSGGMRQRAALARALVVGPDLLLLDEPFGATDYVRRRQLLAMIRALVRDDRKTVLLVTHDLAEAATLAETVVLLTAGPGRVSRTLLPETPPDARTTQDILALTEAIEEALLADAGSAATPRSSDFGRTTKFIDWSTNSR